MTKIRAIDLQLAYVKGIDLEAIDFEDVDCEEMDLDIDEETEEMLEEYGINEVEMLEADQQSMEVMYGNNEVLDEEI